MALFVLIGVAIPVTVLAWDGLRQSEDEAGSLAWMLGHLPDLPLGADGAMVTYADSSLQAAALGVDPPSDGDDSAGQEAWLIAIRQLMLPQATSPYWSNPEWRQAFGFDLFQVDQAVEYAAPPFSVTVLRGRFDVAELRAAWARGGYTPLDLGDGEAYAVREDYEVDVDDSGGRLALAHLNVVALADDGTLIFGSTRDGVRGALAAASGQGPSLADRPEVAPLAQAAPADLVTGLLMHGEVLQAIPDPAEIMLGEEAPDDFATRVAAEQAEARLLPPVASALLGHTAGSFAGENGAATPAPAVQSRIVAVLAMPAQRAAEDAAEVIAERLATQRFPTLLGGDLAGRPWAELFPERSVRSIPDEAAVLIELTPAPGVPPLLLQQMVFQRMPGFLAWSP